MKKNIPKLAFVDSRTSHSINMIIGLIRNGQLQGGEKLPPQDELAERLGISRTSLREALMQLSYRGIVESIHGRGTFVCECGAHEAETLEARMVVEPQLARLAAERREETQLDELDSLCEAMAHFVKSDDTVAFSDFDLKLHCCIAAMTGNRALSQLITSVNDMMLHLQNVVQVLPGAMKRAHDYHLELAEHIRRGDAAAAEDAMRRHLDDVAKSLRKANSVRRKAPGA